MTEMALTPRSWASRTTALASCSLARALTTTLAPSPASFSTAARPILRPDPVTRATLPSSLPMSHLPDDAAEVEGIPIATQCKTGRPASFHPAAGSRQPRRWSSTLLRFCPRRCGVIVDVRHRQHRLGARYGRAIRASNLDEVDIQILHRDAAELVFR